MAAMIMFAVFIDHARTDRHGHRDFISGAILRLVGGSLLNLSSSLAHPRDPPHPHPATPTISVSGISSHIASRPWP